MGSFLVAFTIARTYTTLFPHYVLIGGGLHIHHFWFGLLFLAVGGWLGISYNKKEVNIVAAILYGAGGGLIVDEVGLLLTLGDYWSSLTWTVFVVIVAFASVVILGVMYRRNIEAELGFFSTWKVAPYLGVFLALLSIAFLLEADNLIVIVASIVLLIVGLSLIAAYVVGRLKMERNQSVLI